MHALQFVIIKVPLVSRTARCGITVVVVVVVVAIIVVTAAFLGRVVRSGPLAALHRGALVVVATQQRCADYNETVGVKLSIANDCVAIGIRTHALATAFAQRVASRGEIVALCTTHHACGTRWWWRRRLSWIWWWLWL